MDRPAVFLLLGLLAVAGAVGLAFDAVDAVEGDRALDSGHTTAVRGELHGDYGWHGRAHGWAWDVSSAALGSRTISVHRPDNGVLAAHNDQQVEVELDGEDVVAIRLSDGTLVRTTAGSAYGIVRDVVGGALLLCGAVLCVVAALATARVRGGWWRRGTPGEMRRHPVGRPLAGTAAVAFVIALPLGLFLMAYALGLVWWGAVLVPVGVAVLLVALGIRRRRRGAAVSRPGAPTGSARR